jgi:predicted glutamine amidotransferase
MFLLVGDYSTDLPNIFESLKDAAYDDLIYHQVYKRKISHDDGWGYVLLSQDSVHYDRIYKPIFECDLPVLPGSGALLMHARKAAEGEPLGPLNCHPHHRSNYLLDVYLSHNGAFDKRRIADLIGVDIIEGQTDSEFFLDLLMSKNGSVLEKLRSSIADMHDKELVKSTGNIFLVYRDKMSGDQGAYYYSTAKKPNEYTSLYAVKGPDWSGIFSSTIVKSKYFPNPGQAEKVPMDVLFKL